MNVFFYVLVSIFLILQMSLLVLLFHFSYYAMMLGSVLGCLIFIFAGVFFFLPLLSFLLYNHSRFLTFKGWVLRYLVSYAIMAVGLWGLFHMNVQVGLGSLCSLLVVKFSFVLTLFWYFLKKDKREVI